MKKLLLALAMVFCVAGAQAQRASEAAVWSEDNDAAHSGFFVNPVLGAYVGDIDDTGFGFGADLGYRLHLTSGLHWNILTAGWNSGLINGGEDIEYLSNVRILTGARYNTPRILAGKSMYVNFDLGCSINTYSSDAAFAYNLGVGVNLSRLISLGVAWDGISKDGYNLGIIGLKLGINF